MMKPFTPAQRRRLYDNSPLHHKDAVSFAGFERIVTLTEHAHGICAARQSADALDAARYRWLKDIANTEQIGVGESSDDFRWLYGDEADAAIDAAMARESAAIGGAR